MTLYNITKKCMANRIVTTVCLWAILIAGVVVNAHAEGDSAKNVIVKGIVKDAEGTPIEGVLINISEMNKITRTDAAGKFSIETKLADVLVFAKRGYKNIQVFGDPEKLMEVTMLPGRDDMDDVIDMPYKQVKRTESLGAISTMSGPQLEKHPVTSLENAFMGSLTGIATYEERSEPGWCFPQLYLRGLRTIGQVPGGEEYEGWNPNRNNKPIIIVDNVERDITFLDAYSIESVTVLKDNASAAIYGMKGANGAIIITTKRGIPGKTTIKINTEMGFQQMINPVKYEDAAGYAYSLNRALELDNLPKKYTDEDIELFRNGTDPIGHPNVDYQKEVLREFAPWYRTNFNLSGGNSTARYFLSMTYLRQEGLYKEKWTKKNGTQHVINRWNLRSNIDLDITKRLNVSLDLGGRLDDVKQPRIYVGNTFTYIAETPPTQLLINPDGSYGVGDVPFQRNPAAWIENSGYDQNYKRNLYTNVRAQHKLDFITEGLSVNGLVGFDAYNVFQYGLDGTPGEYYYNAKTGTYKEITKATPLKDWLGWGGTGARELRYNININASIDYARQFGNHNVSAQYLYRQSRQQTPPGNTSPYRHQSYIGQVNYSYKGKYLLQGIGTIMGTDNFKIGDNFGFFPGVSAGWAISEESFLKPIKAIDQIKLRVSWGEAGNDLINPTNDLTTLIRYPYQTIYSEGNGYRFGKSKDYYQGTYEQKAGNLRAKWEISDMTNAGLDVSFWKDRLYATVDVFYEKRTKILVNRSTLPSIYGLTPPKDAVGEVENKGFEIEVGHKNMIGDFGYKIEGNVSFARNKIVYQDEVKQQYDYMQRTGHPINQPFGYIFDGFFQTQEQIDNSPKQTFTTPLKPGNIKWKDLNGDNVIDGNDIMAIGYTPIPEIVSGLTIAMSWKGFDVSALFVGEFHRSVYPIQNAIHSLFWSGKTTVNVKDSWGYISDKPEDNVNAKWPRLTQDNNSTTNDYWVPYGNNFWLMNGDMIRLRNIELGYSIPNKLVQRFGVSELRFYVSGYNIHTWSKITIADPENPGSAAWGYPKTRNFNVGLNLTF